MLVAGPRSASSFSLTPVASVVAAAVAAEDPGFITPLMESLEHDLLPRDHDAAKAFGVRLHSFDAAVERALRDWEQTEEVAASDAGDGVDRHRRAAGAGLRPALDPARLDEWVTIHRRVNSRDAGTPREGYEMEQTLHLRGANFKVRWTLTEAERPGARPGRAAAPPTPTRARATRLRSSTATGRGSTTRTSSRRPAASSAPRRAGC